MYREVLAKGDEVLGAEDPDRLKTMHKLVRTLEAQGKHEEAEAIYREVLANQQVVLRVPLLTR
eukprot:44535-Eustigmatos_ZCMA.PRE.1